jgi:hypothetical protein
MTRSFMKTISEGLVAVITFDSVTSRHHIEVREEGEAFEHWSCVSCRQPLYNEATRYGEDMERALDLKLRRWREKTDLCCKLSEETRYGGRNFKNKGSAQL